MAKAVHSRIKDETVSLLAKKTTEYSSSNEDGPDVLLNDTEVLGGESFDEVWIEVENSTIAKPGYIVKRVKQAAYNNAKIVFAVPAEEDKSRDYYAQRIDTIIGPPEMMHKMEKDGVYRLYTDSNHLRVNDKDGFVLMPEEDTTQSGKWLYDDRADTIRYENGTFAIDIEEPKNGITIDQPENYVYREDDEFRLVNGSDERVVDGFDVDGYKRIPQPVYPFDIPRTRLDKVLESIEYLIFSENVIYRRPHPNCRVYDIGA